MLPLRATTPNSRSESVSGGREWGGEDDGKRPTWNLCDAARAFAERAAFWYNLKHRRLEAPT